MRTIGVVTVGRSDFGIFLPVLNEISNTPGLRARLFVGGTHLSPAHGMTVREVEKSGFEIAAKVHAPMTAFTPLAVARSVGVGVAEFARALQRARPDLLLVLGDRYETFAAVTAALFLNLPVAHIHGGESTEGAIDEALRHAITKMSHLHFVSAAPYAARVVQMGEEPWRVTVCGAPALDAFRSAPAFSREVLRNLVRLPRTRAPFLVTYHPATLTPGQAEEHVDRLLLALLRFPNPVLLTYPNADAESGAIIARLRKFEADHPQRVRLIKNLGARAYAASMKYAAAMVGNSSSGIIEAASFRLPVVNIGDRQKGRIHARNVVSVGNGTAEIVEGLRRVLRPAFRKSLARLRNPYGDGRASERIVRVLKNVRLDARLIQKHFHAQRSVGSAFGR